MAAGDEAQCVDILEELCEMYRRQGALQNASSGLDRFQNAQQQLGDLAELMRSYGFPTPGWSEEDAEGPSDAADMAVDQVLLPTCFPIQNSIRQHVCSDGNNNDSHQQWDPNSWGPQPRPPSASLID